MNSDESFEREVRATLERLASEPAPDRLVTRVAAIPSEMPAAGASAGGGRPPVRNVISGLAAIAAVVALAVAAIVLRPGALPQTGDASASPTQGVPSSEPTPVPSNLMATLPPTIAPTTSRVPTPTPTAPPLAGDPVPAGFRPMSVTFVSTEQGWVLGSAPCAAGRCPAIAHTLDGGKTWTSVPAPATKISEEPAVDVSGSGISGLRFADARDGWAFGPELWATHDGGTTWKRLHVLSDSPALALESARGTVHVVVYDSRGDQSYRIASASVGGDHWTVAPLLIPIGAGPVPVMQLVLSGDAGWILENDRVAVTGARLASGDWQTWQPPCVDKVAQAVIDASSPTELVATCDLGVWGPPPAGATSGDHLYVSHDGGATFVGAGVASPLLSAWTIATPARSKVVVAGDGPDGPTLVASFNAGATWTKVLTLDNGGFDDLGFTTASQGVVISTAVSGASHLLMTHDGGHTWSTTRF